jgi:HEAT repeat protein
LIKKFFAIAIFIFFLTMVGETKAENIKGVLRNLQSPNSKTRLSAVEELGKLKDEEAINLLMDVADTSSEAWEIKIVAIRLLGEIGDPRAINLLTKIFNDPFLNSECPAIKWNTAIALSNFKGYPRVVNTLVKGFEDVNLIIREAIIQSLGKIGDPSAVPFLISALKEKSFAIKISAIKALKEIGDPQAIPTLQDITEHEGDPNLKSEALAALKNFSIKGY